MGLAAAGVVAFKAYQAASDPSVVIAFPQVTAFAEYAALLAIPVMLFLLVYLVQRGRSAPPAAPTSPRRPPP